MSEKTPHNWRGDVLDIVAALARHKWVVVCVMCASLILGYAIASTAEPFYRASTTIVLLPREKPILDLSVQSASVETSEDAAKRSTSATLTLPPNPDLYMTLVRSQEVTHRVAQSLRHDPTLEGRALPTPAMIRAGLSADATEEGVINIRVDGVDPHVSAAVVNALVRECEHASKAIERQLILQQAGFLGRAIEEAESQLQHSRSRLSEFSGRFGVADPSVAAARSAAMIQTLDDTEARLGRECHRLLIHRTSADPAVVALLGEIEDVRTRRDRVRAQYCGVLSEQEYSAISAEWTALQQDVALRRDLLMSMRARHEVFSIRAEQPAGNIAVIRPASIPTSPAGPSRRRFLVFAALLGGLIAGGYCVLADQIRRINEDPETKKQLSSIVRGLASIHPKGASGQDGEVMA